MNEQEAIQGREIIEGTRFDAHERYKKLSGVWLPVWVLHSVENYHNIPYHLLSGRGKCISTRMKKESGPCMIVASGVSLDKDGPFLKDWKYPIFASASIGKTMIYYGRKPDYAVFYDSHPQAMYDKVKDFNWSGTTAVMHPCIDPQIGKFWKWNSLWYRMNLPNSEFFNTVLPIMYTNKIFVGIMQTGSALGQSIQIAHLMGYAPIFLVAGDLCFAGGIKHSVQWNLNPKTHEWYSIPVPPLPETQKLYRDPKSQLLTTEEMLDYKVGIYATAYSEAMNLVNCSSTSLMYELPNISIEKLITLSKEDLMKYVLPPIEQKQIYYPYLVEQGIFKQDGSPGYDVDNLPVGPKPLDIRKRLNQVWNQR